MAAPWDQSIEDHPLNLSLYLLFMQGIIIWNMLCDHDVVNLLNNIVFKCNPIITLDNHTSDFTMIT